MPFQRCRSAATFAILVVVAAPAPAQDACRNSTTPECLKIKQARCRQAADSGLAQAQALPAKGPSETQRKEEIVKKIQTLITENRRQGIDECQTWTQIMGVAFNQ